jgi:thioredoxin reductase
MTKSMAILGAGPIGLELAVRALDAGFDVTVLERNAPGGNIRRWGHVTFFSPWSLNVSPRGLERLDDRGLSRPDPTAYPTGTEYVERYIAVLADEVRRRGRLLSGFDVSAVGRANLLKGAEIGGGRRKAAPFEVLGTDADGSEQVVRADIVVDCTGTYGNPNNLGSGGIPARGERRLRDRITYVIPDVLGADRDRFAGRSTLVVGGGYSAITTLHLLLNLAEQVADTRITWLTLAEGAPYARIDGDPLPERDRLAELGNDLARPGSPVRWLGAATIDELAESSEKLRVCYHTTDGNTGAIEVDNVVANVGYRPDNALYRELQIHQCYASEGPMKLAAALLAQSGTAGDCLKQVAPGAETLRNPEPDFYILGSKSYGRSSQFLLKIGLEQIEQLMGMVG